MGDSRDSVKPKFQENARFPVKFPVSKEVVTETGSTSTASPANQSGLLVRRFRIARIRAAAGLLASCAPSLDSPIMKSTDNSEYSVFQA